MKQIEPVLIGTDHERIEGVDKVTGAARYSAEIPLDDIHHVWPVQATIPKGRVLSVNSAAALAVPGVVAVFDHTNAPRTNPDVGDPALLVEVNVTLNVLQDDEVIHRGQVVAAVVATTLEAAREAAAAVVVEYEKHEHKVVMDVDDPDFVFQEILHGGVPNRTERGDAAAALAAAPVQVDVTYSTPAEHANPIEPHATTAVWNGDDDLTLYEATQSPSSFARIIGPLFGIPVESVHVIADHVGGGFGSKGFPLVHTVLPALVARAIGKPVKISLTRQQMFSLVSHRVRTVQRLRIGADRDGRLLAIDHDVRQYRPRLVHAGLPAGAVSKTAYAVPNLSVRHHLLSLDVPLAGWVRAPGEAPGMYALESAMDELAHELGMDPVELRILNEPEVDPDNGRPYSSRGLVACMREGADRIGWHDRDPAPGRRREGRWLVGLGMAAGCYPTVILPSQASAAAEPDGRYRVRIAAVDIGTGARTALTMIAADALGVTADRVLVELGRSDYPVAPLAGGSLGTASWGWAVVKACQQLRAELDRGAPREGLEVTADTTEEFLALKPLTREVFGAHFARVRVDVDSGETRLDRMVSVFGGGRIINVRGARSQLLGGMIMGVSMALHEQLEMDGRFGDFANHDLASYHFAAHADIHDLEAHWLDERDEELNPFGAKGLGEIGIVGVAAAIGNAVHHATGVRVRDLPITIEKVQPHLTGHAANPA
ncbi:xanthine dehydrogenase family protein molybdopterin-binding subunit [Lentzea sp. NPDC058450]|uniref:xanthine dehydrogenase family protein molybdopterin-binding subunit n=1 Tax=Lentzea sp. NPDC058450 TaxID=3346505 RepID=UPI003654F6D5